MPDDRAKKRQALAVLFALFPKTGATAAESIDTYLRAAAKVDSEVYVQAIDNIMAKWTYPNPPLPGDIAKEVGRVITDVRARRRAQKREAYQAQLRRDAMTPGQAQALLQEAAQKPEPTGVWESVAHKVSVWLLRKRAGAAKQIGGGDDSRS